jgi:hypothetical protein
MSHQILLVVHARCSQRTVPQPGAPGSEHTGTNIAGKPRIFLPDVGGFGAYRKTCDKTLTRNYEGFTLTG